jgi:hypothetical protein
MAEMRKWRKWAGPVASVVVCLTAAAPAGAQVQVPQVAARADVDQGIRGTFSLMGSYGLDLDLFGDVLTAGVGETPTRIVQVAEAIAYPQIYVATPRRQIVTAGFGVFQRRELIVRFSRTENAAEPVRVGDVFTASGQRTLTATVTSYKDQSIEAGLRHYFKATGPSRKYVNLLFGRRKIEAIAASLTGGTEDSDLGTLRLYDAATVPTAAIIFGATWERGFVGVYVEAGIRWTQKLPRQDDDLRADRLEGINNTGSRTFMPAAIGIVFRK